MNIGNVKNIFSKVFSRFLSYISLNRDLSAKSLLVFYVRQSAVEVMCYSGDGVDRRHYQCLSDAIAAVKSKVDSKANSDCDVIVVLAGELVLIEAVTLPKLSKAQLLQALPFSLEEQLVEEVEQLYFFSGQRDKEGCLAVAVINKQVLNDVLLQMRDNGIVPVSVKPDYLSVSKFDDSWMVVFDKQFVMVRISDQLGFTIEKENLLSLLNLNLLKCDQVRPEKIMVFGDLESIMPDSLAGVSIEHIDIDGYVHHPFDFSSIVKQSGINLIPHDFNFKVKSKSIRSYWYLAGVNLAFAVLFSLFGLLVQYELLVYSVNSTQKHIDTLATQLFPENAAKSMGGAKLEQQLLEEEVSFKASGFIRSLNAVAGVLHHHPELSLVKLDYKGTQLILTIRSKQKKNNIPLLLKQFKQAGFAVAQQGVDQALNQDDGKRFINSKKQNHLVFKLTGLAVPGLTLDT